MDISKVQVYGITILIVGLVVRYLMNRRRFNRRNFAGVQTFDSYEHKVAVGYFERFFRIIAKVLIIFGIFLIAIEWFNHRNTAKVQQSQSSPSAQK